MLVHDGRPLLGSARDSRHIFLKSFFYPCIPITSSLNSTLGSSLWTIGETQRFVRENFCLWQ